ncbi:MAG TPA: hypothetical protein VGF48_16645 [Thermoanaerobaculia bacterium]|jgi:hypothetical protein
MDHDDDAKPPVNGGSEVVPIPDAFAPLAKATAPVSPEMIVTGMEHLKERIPEFTQHTTAQKRSKLRAAHLHPEVIHAGIQAAARWDRTRAVLGRGEEELRREEEDIRHWDEAIRSFSVVLDGMIAANLTRKHRLGTDILTLYNLLAYIAPHSDPEAIHIRPYFEEMQRMYKKHAKVPKRKRKSDPERGAGDEQPPEE